MTKKNPKLMSSLQIPITWRVCLFTAYIDHYLHRSLHIRTDQAVSCLLIQFSSERHAEIQNLSKSVNM